jgi:hypothetical protein
LIRTQNTEYRIQNTEHRIQKASVDLINGLVKGGLQVAIYIGDIELFADGFQFAQGGFAEQALKNGIGFTEKYSASCEAVLINGAFSVFVIRANGRRHLFDVFRGKLLS